MGGIDQAEFQLNQAAALAIGLMVGFLVFAVALDLTWAQFRRVLKDPKAPGIGLIAQFLILPAVAFAVGVLLVDTPSVALGLLLVACCPGGALSNYLTGVARGSVATSISMTAVSTLVCIVVTPLLFAFWAALNPATLAMLTEVQIDPGRVVMSLVVMLLLPVSAGMLIRAKRPHTAEKIRVWVRRAAIAVFVTVVTLVLGANAKLLVDYAIEALPPVLLTFTIALALGWALAKLAGLMAEERRAVAVEVGMQNVSLAIAMALAVFPTLGGVVITATLWGLVHVVLGSSVAACWAWLTVHDEGRPLAESLPTVPHHRKEG